MKPVPTADISGTVTRLNFDTDPDGAVTVAYLEDDDGRITRYHMRFPTGAVGFLRHQLDQGTQATQ